MSQTLSYTPVDEIPQIHQDLRKAFISGKTKSIAFRKQQLLNLCYLLEDNYDRFKQAFAADLGRPYEESELLELNGTLLELKETYDKVEEWASPEKAPFNMLWFAMSPITRKEPKGVVLIISPFNYPVYLTLCPLAGAIAAGNTVMLKPSELSEATAALLTELLPKYLDPELYRVVNGAVPETTKILELPFDHILYTGNGRVARIVLAAAAKHLTPVTTELGGKSPCVIDPRCDIKTAAKRIMWGKLVNGGQLCLSPDYVLVPDWFQDKFVEALKDAYHELHPVDPKESGLVCRMVNERHAIRVKNLIDNTKGTIVFGGEVDVATKYAAPALIKNVKGDDSLMSEEIFGPFLPVIPVKDVDEAIEFINERDHPLNIYVFSNDPAFKAKVFDNTQSGTVAANDTILHVMAYGVPFGGVGPSGSGFTTGKYSFEVFTHLRCQMDNPSWIDPALMAARYTPFKPRPLAFLNMLLHPRLPPRNGGRSVAQKLSLGFILALTAALSAYLVHAVKKAA
ncbi:aldehyde dehydrogenase [Laetiporus sulphureus 93-53]|uniref:Aldehyde dehydrogenase n=1 Tax=Laetiporus sulphureus 93-53 TaxID=1314785 RepID=A0A165HWR5_9APHY|nr:aldehyde dehydrogenase [Laetiporus sulphureus 93-53]KZT12290.1 aldehyde dehydrogenase [Laetiporus sulphureus 93-53]